jgi:hypothetical protein
MVLGLPDPDALVRERYGFEDPDPHLGPPYQNVTDPQHFSMKLLIILKILSPALCKDSSAATLTLKMHTGSCLPNVAYHK